MKLCFKCNIEKPLDDFYRHKAMRDGHLNKCKACTRNDVGAHRAANRAAVQAYDRKRATRPERKAHALQRERRARTRNPEKERARTRLKRAVKTGKVQRLPCEVCGEPKSQAHHEDYSQPLNVKWLCFTHHREAHGQQPGAI
jgi:hypothetical protein